MLPVIYATTKKAKETTKSLCAELQGDGVKSEWVSRGLRPGRVTSDPFEGQEVVSGSGLISSVSQTVQSPGP